MYALGENRLVRFIPDSAHTGMVLIVQVNK
jgi:hypothetical protein